MYGLASNLPSNLVLANGDRFVMVSSPRSDTRIRGVFEAHQHPDHTPGGLGEVLRGWNVGTTGIPGACEMAKTLGFMGLEMYGLSVFE